MPFQYLDELEVRTLFPGFHGKFVHTDALTLSYWRVDAGATLPEHSHPQQQMTLVIEGTFEMTLAGETRELLPGAVAVIPGNTLHAGVAVTDCTLLDVFHPARDDYR
jgi:quercetin dioxygenase-like cupin family protein